MIRWLVLLLTGFPLLAGCGASVKSLYPQMAQQKESLRFSVLTDYVVIDASSGDTGRVDVALNQSLGEVLSNAIAESLRVRDYAIDTSLLSSIGLLMDSRSRYWVRSDADPQLLSPPFHVHPLYRPDTSHRRLAHVYTSLINSPHAAVGVRSIIPEATVLGQNLGSTGIVVIMVGGFNVPVTIAQGEGGISPSLTGPVVPTGRVTQVSLFIYMIDARSGEIIWEDRRYRRGGIVSIEKILEMTSSLLSDLP